MADTTPTPLASFDLTSISLVEAIFLECIITTGPAEAEPAGPPQFEVQQVLQEPGFDMEAGLVFYLVNVKARSLNAEQVPTGAVGSFRLRFVFKVENMAAYARTSPEMEEPFPVRDLMIMLGGVAYSTTRGLLLGKTTGTVFSGFALPLRSPLEIFEESIDTLATRAENAVPARPRRRVDGAAPPKRPRKAKTN